MEKINVGLFMTKKLHTQMVVNTFVTFVNKFVGLSQSF